MTHEKPLVSIGLSVYNGEEFIRLALESLVKQTYENIEVIVSDNGSTDATPDICRAYADKYDFITFYGYEENRGVAWNRNNAFHLSTGEYFMWFSHDDLFHEQYVEKCVEAIRAREDTCIVYSKIEVIDADGSKVPSNEDLPDLNVDDVVQRFKICLNPTPYNQSVIYGLMRRSDMASTPLHGDYVAADRCLVAQLSLIGKMYQIPEYLFYRRQHIGNIGSAIGDMTTYRPGVKIRFIFPEWNVLKEHVKTASSFQGSGVTKLRLYGEIIRWFFSRRKMFTYELAGNAKKALLLVFRKA